MSLFFLSVFFYLNLLFDKVRVVFNFKCVYLCTTGCIASDWVAALQKYYKHNIEIYANAHPKSGISGSHMSINSLVWLYCVVLFVTLAVARHMLFIFEIVIHHTIRVYIFYACFSFGFFVKKNIKKCWAWSNLVTIFIIDSFTILRSTLKAFI